MPRPNNARLDNPCAGAALGGIIGGLLGGYLGAEIADRHPRAGAITGSAAGALIGALIGADINAHGKKCRRLQDNGQHQQSPRYEPKSSDTIDGAIDI